MVDSSRSPVTWKTVSYNVPNLLTEQHPGMTRSRRAISPYDLTEASVHNSLPRHQRTDNAPYRIQSAAEADEFLDFALLAADTYDPGKMQDRRPEIQDVTMRARMDSDTLPHGDGVRRRNSSVYSTDSNFSTNTAGTTISDIVEMYRNITLKQITTVDMPSEVRQREPIQPQSYRDTIVPLLQHRFSYELSSPSHGKLPITPSTPARPGPSSRVRHFSRGGMQSPYDAGPSFMDFPRVVQQQRQTHQPSELASAQFQKIHSGASDAPSIRLPKTIANDHRRTRSMTRVQAANSYTFPNQEIVPQPLNVNRRIPGERTYTVKSAQFDARDLRDGDRVSGTGWRPNPQQDLDRGRQMDTREELSHRRAVSHMHNRLPPQFDLPDTTNNVRQSQALARRSASTGSRRTRLQKKNRQSQDDRESQSSTPSTKRSASARRPDAEKAWSEKRRNSMKAGVNAMTRRLSATSMSRHKIPPVPQTPIQHPAIPLTPYQLYGPKAFEEEIKQELKEEKKRAKEDLKLEKARRSMEKKEANSHRRTISARSTYGIGTMLEGLKHSLIRSASEKRREKLKASIVVVGPTTLTAENNAINNMI